MDSGQKEEEAWREAKAADCTPCDCCRDGMDRRIEDVSSWIITNTDAGSGVQCCEWISTQALGRTAEIQTAFIQTPTQTEGEGPG